MKLNRKQFSTEVAGKPLTFEVSRIAEQANAAVIGKYGETIVLVTTVMSKEDKNMNYMPLIVDYEEKFYAAGKILGSRYMRREGKSSDEATLTARMIDRTIRPLFDQNIRRDMQIIVTILSFDGENDPDFVALATTSVALAISDIPWAGPIGGIRIAKIADKYVVNPTISQLAEGFDLECVVTGPKNRINMIELEGKQVQEEEIEKAFELGQKEINKLIKFQEEVIKEIGKEKANLEIAQPDSELIKKVEGFLENKLEEAMYVADKDKSRENLSVLHKEMTAMLEGDDHKEEELAFAGQIFEKSLDNLFHQNIIENEKRPDGRKIDEVRDLYAEVGLFERQHGSALFARGSTQSLGVTTLASPGEAQQIDSLEFQGKKNFFLHYNFPPYSTGETGWMRGPGRREIGHGALAEKALKNVIPDQSEFPYTIRLVSEILSSNGSSSMASVCASSMSLMDAGVPIKNQVAGIAMGLAINEKGDYKVLTDIQGPEDHHGDMDFKVAGTKDGITTVQLDVKVDGLTADIIKDTLSQAKKARLHILEALDKAIKEPRKEVSKHAPTIVITTIDPDKIGAVVGSGGKTINKIIEDTGATTIDIDQSGEVYIAADTTEAAEAAKKIVDDLTHEYKVGEIVEGKIVKILEFGAILEFGYNSDGMIHVSELKDGFVKKVEDVVKEGDFVRAKIIKTERGKVSLSLKGLKE
jgi:polyribonucleotide nucleotidyltransferase